MQNADNMYHAVTPQNHEKCRKFQFKTNDVHIVK